MRLRPHRHPVVHHAVLALALVAVSANRCTSGDCVNGKGIKVWASGSTYVGSFRKGKRDGLGRYTTKVGRAVSNATAASRPHPSPRTWRLARRDPQNDEYAGGYSAGQRSGFGVYKKADGTLFEGLWRVQSRTPALSCA